MTEILLWDNDGVLVETEPLFFQANAEVLADLGIEYSLSQFRNISLLQGTSALNLAKARGVSDSDILALRETRDARYAELLRGKDLALPGVRDVLHELSNQYRMAVVTSSRATHFEIIHEHSKLLPYFEFVLTVDNVTQTKPHPEPYLCALDKAQLSASAGQVFRMSTCWSWILSALRLTTGGFARRCTRAPTAGQRLAAWASSQGERQRPEGGEGLQERGFRERKNC